MSDSPDFSLVVSTLDYFPGTGEFVWKVGRGRAAKGSRAGTVNGSGYAQIRLDGKIYRAHQLAWYISFGVWPKQDIDHINRSRNDNRLSNLRLATRSENCVNARPRPGGTSKYKGVSFDRRTCKWVAQTKVNQGSVFLGRFMSEEDAAEAYLSFTKSVFGAFASETVESCSTAHL